jgi:hypothetical protein
MRYAAAESLAGAADAIRSMEPHNRAAMPQVPEADLVVMGGDVTVASEPGKGSVFTVRLPGSGNS